MKALSDITKAKVIELFLKGLSFDEISLQQGIAKGSVENIIDMFRDGELPIPPGMAEYVDELRHLVVDMKKQKIIVAQVKSCFNIHKKLLKMGVNSTQVEQWLDMCQDIASSAASDNQFIQAAIELAQVTASTGFSYKALVDYYHASLKLE
jgi:hypothetical protein